MKAHARLYWIGILAICSVTGIQLTRSLKDAPPPETLSATEMPGSHASVPAARDPRASVATKPSLAPNRPEIVAARGSAPEPVRASVRTRLLSQLESASSDERAAALIHLNRMDEAEAIAIAAAVLAQDDDPGVRREAIRALDHIGGDDAVAVMATALSDRDVDVRHYALESLSASGRDVVHLLGQALFGDPDPEVRRLAVLLLSANGSPAAGALVRAALSDEDEAVRHAAERVAEGGPAIPGTTADETEGGTHPEVQRSDPILVASDLDEADALRGLRGILAREQNVSGRLEPVDATPSSARDDARELLETAMSDSDAGVRYRALLAIGEGGASVTRLLSQVMFGDEDPRLRRRAAELLGEQSSPAAIALLRAAADGDDETISQTARAAYERKVAEAGPELEAAPRPREENEPLGPEQEVRERLLGAPFAESIFAIQAEYALDDAEMSRILATMLSSDEDVRVREGAIAALAGIPGDEARDAMASALGDDDASIREQAVGALWNSGSENVPFLAQTLFSDPDPELRSQVVRLLAADGGSAAMALLSAATEDPDENVRLLARAYEELYGTR